MWLLYLLYVQNVCVCVVLLSQPSCNNPDHPLWDVCSILEIINVYRKNINIEISQCNLIARSSHCSQVEVLHFQIVTEH